MRALLRRIACGMGLLASAWALETWSRGGFAIAIGSLRISSHDPSRPLVAAAVCWSAYLALTGLAPIRDAIAERVRRLGAPRLLVASAALAMVTAGVMFNSGVVGGSDSYGYLSQADLWLSGRLVTPVPAGRAVPWPHGVDNFAPLGYEAARRGAFIVPTYSPGYPLLMAGAKLLVGHAAAFWVVPLSGGLLVWLTFLVGRRLGADRLAAAAAWLVATSPVVLFMTVSTMADVPAAAFWMVVVYGAIRATPASTAGAGLATSIAILIRPNLAPLAAVIAAWVLWRDVWQTSGWRKIAGVCAFAAGTIPACIVVAVINAKFYGSPMRSGYGTLGQLFSMSNVPVNTANYGGWLVQTHTPLIVAGFVALGLPFLWMWRTPDARRLGVLLALVAAVVCAMYLLYQPMDAWWYLRFLLPAFPMLFIGLVFLLDRLLPAQRTWARLTWMAVLAALGVHGLVVARDRGVWHRADEERRYVVAARLVRIYTEDASVIFACQESGSILYYGHRPILRYDGFDPAWLDRGVLWLRERGLHPYALLETWEVESFRRRFAGKSRLANLRMGPVFTTAGSGEPALYDLLAPDVVTPVTDRKLVTQGPALPHFPAPDPAPTLILKNDGGTRR